LAQRKKPDENATVRRYRADTNNRSHFSLYFQSCVCRLGYQASRNLQAK